MDTRQPGTASTTIALFVAAGLLMALLWLAIDSNHFHIVSAAPTTTAHRAAAK